jgi:UDP-N-acetylmuramoyl-tripeptide--D-alanyl-D-alanine ligase
MGAVERGMASLAIPRGRMEVIDLHGVRFVNDGYNASRESYRALMREVANLHAGRPGRVHGICAGVRELGRFAPEHHRDIVASIALAGIDRVALIGAEFNDADGATPRCERFGTADALPERWLAAVQPGDTVILKGSRFYAVEKVMARLHALLALRGAALAGAA